MAFEFRWGGHGRLSEAIVTVANTAVHVVGLFPLRHRETSRFAFLRCPQQVGATFGDLEATPCLQSPVVREDVSVFTPKELDATKDPWAYFGAVVRRYRGSQSQVDVADAVHVSKQYVSHIEHAVRRPERKLVKALDKALGADGAVLAAFEMAVNASSHGSPEVADYFAAVVELEARATRIDWYSQSFFPGIVQTKEYATAITRAFSPFRSPEEVESLVAGRMARAEILSSEDRPQLMVILDEAVLARPVGTPDVWARQLSHVLELIDANKLVLQILPFSAGAHALLSGQLIILRFSDAPPLAYTEAPHTGQVLEGKALVDACTLSYDLARAAALSPEASQARIEAAMKEICP
ncbi:helix-turn-helix transcriptional regulator [Streptomyces buecherae]|uniref:helix-turn-helix domain-containing protein n=1 Tax=Streptomyces buecherae TaxID=2763006 RepID=UPI00340DB4A1